MRFLGLLALLTLFLTVAWLVLLIVQMTDVGSIDTYEDALAYARNLDTIHYLTYLATALLTGVIVALFAQLYNVYRTEAPDWSLIALVFVPIYGVLNLVVYSSQAVVLPRLADTTVEGVETLLAYSVQLWPESPVAFANLLAYTILGVPSVIFGRLIFRQPGALRVAGGLLVASGILSLADFFFVTTQVEGFVSLSVISGVLFLLALVALVWATLHPKTDRGTYAALESKATS